MVKDFFSCSLTYRRQLFHCSTFPQVALSMKILPTLRLPSSKISIHNNDSHIMRFFGSSKLRCPDAKPQCYNTCYVLQRNTTSIMNIGFNYAFVSVCKVNLSAQLLYVVTRYGQKVFIEGRWYAASKKVQKWYTQKAKGWELLTYY